MSRALLPEIVACFGQSIAGNPTQFLLERAFAEAGLDWRCLSFEIEPNDLVDTVRGARAMNFLGLICTTPHNRALVPLLDEVSAVARQTGAVNLVTRRDGKLIGDNTLGTSFLKTLTGLVDLTEREAVVLGSGVVATSILTALMQTGLSSLKIISRSPHDAKALAESLAPLGPCAIEVLDFSSLKNFAGEPALLVNATNLGTSELASKFAKGGLTLRPDLVVADVVYNPAETKLLHAAHANGCRTISGIELLIQQVLLAFETWTGQQADEAALRDALEEFLAV